jgi:hypothetical protein
VELPGDCRVAATDDAENKPVCRLGWIKIGGPDDRPAVSLARNIIDTHPRRILPEFASLMSLAIRLQVTLTPRPRLVHDAHCPPTHPCPNPRSSPSVAVPISARGHAFGVMCSSQTTASDATSADGADDPHRLCRDDATAVTENVITRFIEAGDPPPAALKGAKQIGFHHRLITPCSLRCSFRCCSWAGIITGRSSASSAVTPAWLISPGLAVLLHAHADDARGSPEVSSWLESRGCFYWF